MPESIIFACQHGDLGNCSLLQLCLTYENFAVPQLLRSINMVVFYINLLTFLRRLHARVRVKLGKEVRSHNRQQKTWRELSCFTSCWNQTYGPNFKTYVPSKIIACTFELQNWGFRLTLKAVNRELSISIYNTCFFHCYFRLQYRPDLERQTQDRFVFRRVG